MIMISYYPQLRQAQVWRFNADGSTKSNTWYEKPSARMESYLRGLLDDIRWYSDCDYVNMVDETGQMVEQEVYHHWR